jgi:D-tyrosyl-tRNA(Tyr) deacylase
LGHPKRFGLPNDLEGVEHPEELCVCHFGIVIPGIIHDAPQRTVVVKGQNDVRIYDPIDTKNKQNNQPIVDMFWNNNPWYNRDMKLVIQRVKQARVTAENHTESIGLGLFILFGAGTGDTEEMAKKLAQKVYKMRLMKDENDKMNKSVVDVNGEFLVVSQFTLYGDTSGGNRPSFVNALAPDEARKLYELFVDELRNLGAIVKTGSFGNYMNIETTLDGPVTILVES